MTWEWWEESKPYVPEVRTYLLAPWEAQQGPLILGDGLLLAEPIIADLSLTAAEWWKDVVCASEAWYKHHMSLSPLDRIKHPAGAPSALCQEKSQRVERRVASMTHDPAVNTFTGGRRVGSFKTVIKIWSLDLLAGHLQPWWSIWEAELAAQSRRSSGDPKCLGQPNCLETVASVEDKNKRPWCNCPWPSTTTERVAEDDQKNLGKPSRVAIQSILGKIRVASGHNTKWSQCGAVCISLVGRVWTTCPHRKTSWKSKWSTKNKTSRSREAEGFKIEEVRRTNEVPSKKRGF